MARQFNRLSSAFVQSAPLGRHADGAGLYLQVHDGNGARHRSWLFRYRERWMGLGPTRDVSLAQARRKAQECRQQLLAGLDPIEEKRRRACQRPTTPTFDQCALAYWNSHCAGWRSVVHAGEWKRSLAAYASPVFGKEPVDTITTAHVMRALEPYWRTRADTMSRVRGRIESVLDWARVQGHREGDNPARWRGHLENLLPAKAKIVTVNHFAAMPYAELGRFMAELRTYSGTVPLALEFTILTAVRTGDVLGGRWSEIEMATATWTIPAERTKSRREHRIPLSNEAVTVLREVKEFSDGSDIIFGGQRRERLSHRAMPALMRRMGRPETVHGFRSSFRDWAAEQTSFSNDVVEISLAHAVGTAMTRAYQRGDQFERRRKLMSAWAKYCSQPSMTSEVIPLHIVCG